MIPISTATACVLSIDNKIIYGLIIKNTKNIKNNMNETNFTIKSFEKFYRNSLQDNVIDKNEQESLCNIFTKCVDENKNESFLQT